MAKVARFPYIFIHRDQWYARVKLSPKRKAILGPILGRTDFLAPLDLDKTVPAATAYAVATPIVAEWQAKIKAADTASADPINAEIAKLANAFKATGEAETLPGIIAFVFKTVGGMSAVSRRAALLATGGNVPLALEPSGKAQEAFAVMTGTATPFLTHRDAWDVWASEGSIARKPVTSTTLHEYRQTLSNFAKVYGGTLEALSRDDVKAWVKALAASPGNGKSGNGSATIARKLSALRSYVTFLIEERKFDASKLQPWVKAPAKKDGEGIRDRFEPSDVAKLIAAADGCQALADFIMVGAYTGSRRESIAQLKVASIQTSPDGIRFFAFRGKGSKTESGKRDTPIHSAIAPIVDRLIAGADADGYLFPGIVDKDGKRGAKMGGKFSTLKQSMGYSDIQDFHSLRHTVLHMFETARTPEGIAQDFVGHKKKGLSYGVYSGRNLLSSMSEEAERALRYPTA